jgi:hypothetical protein
MAGGQGRWPHLRCGSAATGLGTDYGVLFGESKRTKKTAGTTGWTSLPGLSQAGPACSPPCCDTEFPPVTRKV